MRMLWLSVLVIMTLACGGGGGVDGGSGGGGTLSVEERTAIITSIERKVENLTHPGQSADQLTDAVLAYVQTRPEFNASGKTTEQCVWARFSDGRYLVIGNNRVPQRFQRPNPDRGRTVPTPRPGAVTTSTRARVFHTFGANFIQQQNPIAKMIGYLTAAGYTVDNVSEGDGRLTTLRAVSNPGYLYINSHGGSFKKPDGSKIYLLLSSTKRTNETERQPEIAADLEDGSVVYGTYTNGETTTNVDGESVPARDTRYGITYKFVDKYWALGNNAVVFLNACWSGYTGEPGAAQEMIAALHRKGAGVVLGWTDKVFSPGSEDIPTLLVDRLCASNDFQKESPDQRPFFVQDILAEMKKEGTIPNGQADLVAFPKTGVGIVGLRPTIHYLDMSEPFGVLDLYGEFGDAQGEVFVGGVKATVRVWVHNNVTVAIPDTGAGSFGDVFVRTFGKKSNTRRLTKWVANSTYTENGQGSLRCVINAKLVFRADLAKRRSKPGDPVELIDPIPVFASPESTCSFTASGSHTNGPTLIEAWSGSGTVALTHFPFSGAQPKWFCNGSFDPVTREFSYGFMCGGPKQITGQVGNASVPAGGAAYMAALDASWIGPPWSTSGSVAYTFSSLVPQSAPDPTMQFRPVP